VVANFIGGKLAIEPGLGDGEYMISVSTVVDGGVKTAIPSGAGGEGAFGTRTVLVKSKTS
jgi:hypothetical protein